MRRYLLILLFAVPAIMQAQTYNALFFSLNGGVAGKPTGAATGAHIGYGLQKKHFILNIGLGAEYYRFSSSIDDYTERIPATDSQGIDYTQQRDYTNGNQTNQQVELQLPVMAGAEFKHFYFLAGITPAIRIYEHTTTEGEITITAHYDMFYDPFEDMPNHGYTTYPYNEKHKSTDLTPLIYASAEIGVPIKQFIHIGLYANYQLLPQPNYPDFSVGLKLTAYLKYKQKSQYPCRCIIDN